MTPLGRFGIDSGGLAAPMNLQKTMEIK